MKNNNVFIFKACTSSYVVLCSPYLLLIILFLSTIFFRGNEIGTIEYLKLFSIPLALFSCFFVWLKGFKLQVTNEELIYRDGFYREKRVFLKNIECSTIKPMIFGRFSRIPIPCLVITPIDSNQEPIMLNIKSFSPNDLSKLFELLNIEEKFLGLKIKKLKQGRANK